MREHISGKDATYMAIESDKRGPVQLQPWPADGEPNNVDMISGFNGHHRQMRASRTPPTSRRKAPPRVRKPSPRNDQCLAPTPDLEAHRLALRQAFGETLSNEFAEVMLGKLVTAMRPGPFDSLDEATLNAAIPLISSMNPRTELAAMMAVQIAATGFAGLKFLRQSQHHMDEILHRCVRRLRDEIVQGQVELLHAMDRHQRGNQQTVEVRHVISIPVLKAWWGCVNARPRGRDKMKDDPMHPKPELAPLRQVRCGAKTRSGKSCQSSPVSGKARCRMHGGAPGSGGPSGVRNGNYCHGRYTREALAIKNSSRMVWEARTLIKR